MPRKGQGIKRGTHDRHAQYYGVCESRPYWSPALAAFMRGRVGSLQQVLTEQRRPNFLRDACFEEAGGSVPIQGLLDVGDHVIVSPAESGVLAPGSRTGVLSSWDSAASCWTIRELDAAGSHQFPPGQISKVAPSGVPPPADAHTAGAGNIPDIGVHNSGNDCFVTAGMHLLNLAATERLPASGKARAAAKSRKGAEPTDPASARAADAVMTQLRTMRDRLKNPGGPRMGVAELRGVVGKCPGGEQFGSPGQHDAGEFLACVIRLVSDAWGKHAPLRCRFKIQQMMSCDGCKKDACELLPDNSVLLMPIAHGSKSVADFLHEYFSAEQVPCADCRNLRRGRGQPATKTFVVNESDAPGVLLICVMRFVDAGAPVRTAITVDENVNLPVQGVSGTVEYHLSGVACHKPGLGGDSRDSGHYVTHVRLDGDTPRWWCVDDHVVHASHIGSIPADQAYILLYQRAAG